MEDNMVGADLQQEPGSSNSEQTSAPSHLADQGGTRDRMGNIYDEPRQGQSRSNQAPGSAGNPGATQGQAGQGNQGDNSQPTRQQINEILQAVQAANNRAQQAEARLAQYDQARWEQQVRALPVDQQRVAVAQRQLELTQLNAQQAAQRQASQQQALEPLFKEIVVTKLVQHYAHAGVNAQMLASFSSPEAMEEFCKAWAVSGRVAANTQRQAAGTDRAASAGSRAAPAASNWRGTSLRDQLSAAFD